MTDRLSRLFANRVVAGVPPRALGADIRGFCLNAFIPDQMHTACRALVCSKGFSFCWLRPRDRERLCVCVCEAWVSVLGSYVAVHLQLWKRCLLIHVYLLERAYCSAWIVPRDKWASLLVWLSNDNRRFLLCMPRPAPFRRGYIASGSYGTCHSL